MLETDLSAKWSGVMRSISACDMEKKHLFRLSPVVVRVSLDDSFYHAVLSEQVTSVCGRCNLEMKM